MSMHLKLQNSLLRNVLTLLLASIHKILTHGTQIIKLVLLLIGQLSEKAQNKYIKRFRAHYTRKIFRQNTRADLLNNPFI